MRLRLLSTNFRRPGVLLLGALPALLPLVVGGANQTPAHAIALRVDRPVIGGLRLAAPGSPCAGGFEVVGTQLATPPCTHGADRAPAADPTVPDSTTADATANPAEGTTAEATAPPSATAAANGPTGSVACYGDGTTGSRVEVLFAHTPDVADQFASVAPRIAGWAADVDRLVATGAADNGAVRHVRYVVDRNCQLAITDVTLSSGGADTFGATINDLVAHGYNRNDRKYLVFVDSTVYCGISSLSADDRPWASNANNTKVQYARVDRGCWGVNPAAHELMHSMGAVQLSAPHSSGAYHCYDGADIMCYRDGGSYYKNGGAMTSSCPSSYFDCGHDDYFNAGAVPPDSYLGAHWNAANNAVLETQPGTTTSPGPALAPPGAPAEPPPPAKSARYDGSASIFGGTRYSMATGDGSLTAVLKFSGSLTMTLSDSAGHSLGQVSGPGPLMISQTIAGGNNTIMVSKGGLLGTKFELDVTYPAPR